MPVYRNYTVFEIVRGIKAFLRLEAGLTRGTPGSTDTRDREAKDRKVDRINRELELTGPLEEMQRARLLEIADLCSVHRTLESGVVETNLARVEHKALAAAHNGKEL